MPFKYVLAPAAALGLAMPACAATFEVVSGPGSRSGGLATHGPLGQSFVSIDSTLTSFGFQFAALNPGLANAPVIFTLREGEGLSGAVLFTASYTLPAAINNRTPTWYDFALGEVAVATGGRYTATVQGTNNRLGLVYGPGINLNTGQPLPGGGDAYAGGRFITVPPQLGNAICQGEASICDASFRVMGVTPAAVPEPAGWAMMIGGFALVGGAVRRRRREIPAA